MSTKNLPLSELQISPYTDTELCKMILQNNKEGYEYLYDRYSSILYGFTIRAHPNLLDTEEIVEKTFVTIWQSISIFETQKTSFLVWALKILRETITDFLDSKNMKYTLDQSLFPNSIVLPVKSKL